MSTMASEGIRNAAEARQRGARKINEFVFSREEGHYPVELVGENFEEEVTELVRKAKACGQADAGHAWLDNHLQEEREHITPQGPEVFIKKLIARMDSIPKPGSRSSSRTRRFASMCDNGATDCDSPRNSIGSIGMGESSKGGSLMGGSLSNSCDSISLLPSPTALPGNSRRRRSSLTLITPTTQSHPLDAGEPMSAPCSPLRSRQLATMSKEFPSSNRGRASGLSLLSGTQSNRSSCSGVVPCEQTMVSPTSAGALSHQPATKLPLVSGHTAKGDAVFLPHQRTQASHTSPIRHQSRLANSITESTAAPAVMGVTGTTLPQLQQQKSAILPRTSHTTVPSVLLGKAWQGTVGSLSGIPANAANGPAAANALASPRNAHNTSSMPLAQQQQEGIMSLDEVMAVVSAKQAQAALERVSGWVSKSAQSDLNQAEPQRGSNGLSSFQSARYSSEAPALPLMVITPKQMKAAERQVYGRADKLREGRNWRGIDDHFA